MQTTKEVVIVDSDTTPPLTPKKISVPNHVKDTGTNEHLLRKRKRNYRVTNKRYASLNLSCDPDSTDGKPQLANNFMETNDEEDFKKVKLKSPQKNPSCSKVVSNVYPNCAEITVVS